MCRSSRSFAFALLALSSAALLAEAARAGSVIFPIPVPVISPTTPTAGYDYAFVADFAETPVFDTGSFTLSFEVPIVDVGGPATSQFLLSAGGIGETFATYDFHVGALPLGLQTFGFDFGVEGADWQPGGTTQITGTAIPSSLPGPTIVPEPSSLILLGAFVGLLLLSRASRVLRKAPWG